MTACAWSAPAPKARTALVIGNTKYEPGITKLRNATNDAKAVAKTLRGLGFEVIEKQDVTRDQLLQAVEAFRKTLGGAEVALFYYAGHGISVTGANYLVPIKSQFSPNGADTTALRMLAETRLFNVEQAVADMNSGGAACNLVILDACRNTPFTGMERTRSWNQRGGLVEMTPPAGSLIAFATDAGQVAFDGDGANGLYTDELLKHLRMPGLTIEQVFKRTRAGVVDRSGGGQVPAEYSRLIGDDIYLAGKPAQVLAESVPVVASATQTTAAPLGTIAVPLTAEELLKLAKQGQAKQCVEGLQRIAETDGLGDFAVPPLEALLEYVKNDLKQAAVPSPKVVAAADTCELILQALPKCLPPEHPRLSELSAKAHNRRGDALLLLNRADEALHSYDLAVPLQPNDAYILYNRGRAKLALGNKAEAKADFIAASDPRFNQPKAKKLAQESLAEIR